MSRRTTLSFRLKAVGSAADIAIRHAMVWVVQALVLTLMIGAFTDDAVPSYGEALIGIILIAGMNTAVQPALIGLVVRFKAWLFPVVTFLLNAAVFLLADALVPGWRINGVLQAGVVALVLTAVATFMGTLLSISDDGAWRRFALGPLRARYERHEPIDGYGFAFLEIDGLSEPILRQAMDRGYTPHLKAWLDAGTHTLTDWECDLSSQTSASQAGILMGANRNIPAFRWYDKQQDRVIVSNRPGDAARLQESLTTGAGLLIDGGASRGNLFSGEAPDSLFTIGTILQPARSNTSAYFFFYANFYNISRTLALFGADVVRELAASLWQLLRNERPRVRRFGIYPLVRAATTSLLRELSTFTVAGDLMRGVPAIYTTYIAYDEVAHHSGIARGDALRVLRDIDRDIGRLHRVAAESPRPYHLVVLSDHGQSQGATFRQRYGRTLGEVVELLLAGEDQVREYISTDEGWQSLSALLTDLLHQDPRTGSRLQRTLQKRIVGEEVVLDPKGSPRRQAEGDKGDNGRVLVLASGNLGLISFRQWSHRLSMEDIESVYPTLLAGLARHPGVGFVMVRSDVHGPVVIGADGLRILEENRVEGTDPLGGFRTHAADHLRRADAFDNAPDIYVNSMVDPDTGEVAAFEELVGSHGGLGGGQTSPFLLFPSSLQLASAHLRGAEQVHGELKRWIVEAQETRGA